MSQASPPIVPTSTGDVQGIVNEKNQSLFLGIPYAEPPVGNLRFKPTVPKRKWDGVFDAGKFGSAGPQVFDPSEGDYEEFTGLKLERDKQKDWVGSEDNLTLNIWSPDIGGKKRPVVVWIHGGANWLESSRLYTYHGDDLVNRGDVVFVSLNYRLGIFGWLDVSVLGGEEYKGSHSNGLRDQLTALKWIKENIAQFGGDTDNITIMGESAGSIDLSWLLTSGHLDGIAKRVVLMSGIAGLMGLSGDLDYGFTEQYAQDISKDFLARLQINSMDELLAISTDDLMDRYTSVAKSSSTLFLMDSIFWPRIIPDFVPLDPFRAVKQKGKSDIDVMIGYTGYEMGLWLTWDETLDQHQAEWSAEKIMDFTPAQQKEAVALYRENMPNEKEGRLGMHMIGDSIFVMPSLWFAEELARQGSKVWMYEFDWKSDERRGAMHAADQTFIFNSHDTQAGHHICGVPKTEAEAAERLSLTRMMQDAILGFARTGDPNGHSNASLPEWPKYKAESRNIMSFDLTSGVVADPVKNRRDWWFKNIYGPAFK